jgi:hypothetical protein
MEVQMSDGYTLIVYTNPVEGREDEFNKWYDEVHLGEFSSLPGVISGKRFKVAGDKPRAYAAIYELSGTPEEVFAAMNASIKDGSMHMSDCIDSAGAQIVTLTPR